MAAVHRTDGGEQKLGLSILEQKAARARANSPQCGVIKVECREHDDARRGAPRRLGRLQDAHGARDTVGARHPNVHEHHVRSMLGGDADGLLAVAGFADNRQVGLRVDEHAHAAPEQRLVVDEQHANHGHRGSLHGRAAGSFGRRGTVTRLTSAATGGSMTGAITTGFPRSGSANRRH